MVHAPPLFGSAVVKNHATDLKKEGKCHGEIKIFLQYSFKKIIDAIEVIETCFMFK